AGREVAVRTRQLDDWQRELAKVSLGGEDVGAWMVSQGQAWSYRWRRDPGPYVQEEQVARSAGRGLFAKSNPRNPRDFRQQHGPCDRH
ncbi:MAG: thermonuclease family protein, partial [Burkholderiales bacterium]